MNHIQQLEAKGIPISSHESDLYVRDTPAARAILHLKGYHYTSFINQAPPHRGERWLDVAFAYLPWWEARAKTNHNP